MSALEGASFHHTCFVVHDVDATAATLTATLGIGDWELATISPVRTLVGGREVPCVFRIAIAKVGDSRLELAAPVSGEGIYGAHLAEHGESFHHTCFSYETREQLRAAKASLLSNGHEALQECDLGEGGEFCYLALPETGSILELLYLAA